MNISRLLYIQDNSLVQNFYREKLERAGIAVQSVASLEEGLRRFESGTTPDVVVLDPLLADADAVQAITAIRAAQGGAQTPVVVLPTLQRRLAESIEQTAGTKLIEANENTAVALVTAVADAVKMKLPDLAEIVGEPRPDERWRQTALNAGPGAVAEMRVSLHSLVRDPSAHEHLRSLLHLVHCFSDRMSLLGPSAIARVSSALEMLVFGLVEYPERLEGFTLRTLGQAVDFLGSLLETNNALRSAELNSAHVMIVEDEASARELIIMAMGMVGLSADGLDSPSASLAVLSTQPCDLIFLDINLPEMNGFDLCTKLRAFPFHEKTPIVFLTGMNSFQNRVQSNLSGGNDFVGKPFNIAELGVKALIWVLRGQFSMN